MEKYVYGSGKSLENSWNFFSYFVATLFGHCCSIYFTGLMPPTHPTASNHCYIYYALNFVAQNALSVRSEGICIWWLLVHPPCHYCVWY